jgi:hypothetical protein
MVTKSFEHNACIFLCLKLMNQFASHEKPPGEAMEVRNENMMVF